MKSVYSECESNSILSVILIWSAFKVIAHKKILSHFLLQQFQWEYMQDTISMYAHLQSKNKPFEEK